MLPSRGLWFRPPPVLALAIGASLAVHVGVCAALGTSARSFTPPPAPLQILEIAPDLELPPPPPAPKDEPLAERVAFTAAPAHEHAARTDARAVHAVAATETPRTTSPPADAPAAITTDDAVPHFSLAVVADTNAGASSQPLANAAGMGAIDAVADDDATYGAEAVDVPARAVSQALPRYPAQAQAAGLEATVSLEIVLSKTGAVEDVRPRNHAGHGFDEEALSFARRTRFSPAMKRGHPVAVRMIWTVRFELE